MPDRRVLPVPPQLRDTIGSELHDIADSSLRYRIRRLVGAAYADGYADGHGDGSMEVHGDLRAEQRTAAKDG